MQLVFNNFSHQMRWLALLLMVPRQAGAIAIDDTASRQLRRAPPIGEGIIEQAKHAGSQLPIPGMEEEEPKKKEHDQKVMDAISKFRAEVCFDMKKEHDKDFSSFEACEEYMTKVCHPGKDDQMDGDSKEVTSEQGFCKEYFPMAKKKAEEEVKKEEEAAITEVVAASPGSSPFPAPGPAPGPAPAPAQKAPAPAPVASGAGPGPAPAPGPMAGPAPGPVPAPFIPGVSAGKPFGAIPDDEAYYYKAGGKHDDRLHMSESMKLPTQGYWGKLVEHEDMKTVIEDWGHEFGPHSGHDSVATICAKHPENPWCYEQGFGRHRSSAPAVAAHFVPLMCALFSLRAF